MMKFAHTKPPWRVDERGVIWAQATRTDDDDVCIAHTRSYNILGDKTADANARLLAVAPDMAKVLSTILRLVDETWLAARVYRAELSDNGEKWPSMTDLQIALDEARYVMARIDSGKTARASNKERFKKLRGVGCRKRL